VRKIEIEEEMKETESRAGGKSKQNVIPNIDERPCAAVFADFIDKSLCLLV
jgi:hypothetical protein